MNDAHHLTGDDAVLLVLNLKLAVAATLATMLARFRWFRRILLTEQRAWRERLTFAAWLGVPLTVGVLARLLLGYDAADLTLSGSFLAGLIAGPYAGAIVGAAVGLPPIFLGEFAALPFAVGCGFAGGGLREICPKTEIWKFTPFFITRLPRDLWRLVTKFSLDWQMILVMAPVLLEVLRQTIHQNYPLRIFNFNPGDHWWMYALVVLVTVLGVAIPIKIWNSARIEHRLTEQDEQLLRARFETLTNQINPHFLFNTLVSINALIRVHPETARLAINRLSSLLRRVIYNHKNFVTLKDELDAVGEYLDIERIRFEQALVVERKIDDSVLDFVVPSMILQPLVENSIKHGLSKKVGVGKLTINVSRRGDLAHIEVVDNGIGIPEARQLAKEPPGIGLKNVDERLRVVYGPMYRLELRSPGGEGTSASFTIPKIKMPEETIPEKATA